MSSLGLNNRNRFPTALLDSDRALFMALANQAKLLTGYQRFGSIFADGYKASDGVDAGSSGHTVDTTNGLIKPAVTTANNMSKTVATIGSGWNNYTVRQLITAAEFAHNGTKVRLTLVCAGATGTGLDSLYIGQQAAAGNAWDFASTPTQITVNGSTSITVPPTGTIQTDWITFNFDKTKNHIISFNFTNVTNNNTSLSGLGANYNAYFKASADEAAALTPSGYTAASGALNLVSAIDVQTGINNLTLITTPQTLDVSASRGRLVMEVNPVEALTLGTDLTAEITANGGTNYALAALSLVGRGKGSNRLYESADVDLTDGTSFAARIKSLTNKNFEIHRLALGVY